MLHGVQATPVIAVARTNESDGFGFDGQSGRRVAGHHPLGGPFGQQRVGRIRRNTGEIGVAGVEHHIFLAAQTIDVNRPETNEGFSLFLDGFPRKT